MVQRLMPCSLVHRPRFAGRQDSDTPERKAKCVAGSRLVTRILATTNAVCSLAHTPTVCGFRGCAREERAGLRWSFRSTNAVCAAEQTAKGESSRLSSSLEAHCTVRRLCFAKVARRRDRAGTARRVNRPAMESTHSRKVHFMLYTIAVVLLVLWLLGLVTSYTMGGFVHVL